MGRKTWKERLGELAPQDPESLVVRPLVILEGRRFWVTSAGRSICSPRRKPAAHSMAVAVQVRRVGSDWTDKKERVWFGRPNRGAYSGGVSVNRLAVDPPCSRPAWTVFLCLGGSPIAVYYDVIDHAAD